MKIDEKELRRIAAESLTDLRTVRKMYSGEKVRDLVAIRIEAAAVLLRLPQPPKPKSAA